ncbi:MAG TPA: hypothetical protein VF753_05715 [Terriglobales bacterium]
MKPALYFFAPFLVLPLLWIYFSYIRVHPPQKPPLLSTDQIKAVVPEDASPKTSLDPQPAKIEGPTVVASAMTPLDHADAIAVPPSQHFLRQRFVLKDRQDFLFVVPPHTVNPKLQGSFQAFMTSDNGAASQASVEIDFALMDEHQFDDFVHGRRADAVYEQPSAGQTINFAIPPTHEYERHYHLVFMTQSPHPAVVNADFTAIFQ